MRKRFLLRIACILALAIMNPVRSFATERTDIVAGLETLPLLIDKISGDVTMAIIYDPANPASATDAENTKKIIEAGIDIPGGGKLSALLVGVGELGKLSRTRIAFVTTGLAANFTDISIATSAASVLTISTDINCVKAGICIIGVSTQPKTTIYFNKAAADAAKIEFTQAFAMLVRQL